MKKGFSVIKAIVILFVISALGFGGYYGYNNYLSSSNSAFIPESLKEYAQGENADFFIIFDDQDSYISSLMGELEPSADINMKSGLVIFNISNECGSIAVEFDSEDSATRFKNTITEFRNSVPDVIIEQKNEILTIAIEDDGTCLKGNLIDNPLFENLDSEHEGDQVIVALDNQESFDLTMMLMGSMATISGARAQSSIPVAHAQMISSGDTPSNIVRASDPEPTFFTQWYPQLSTLLYTAESTYIYTKVDDVNLDVIINVKVMDKSILEDSYIYKQRGGSDLDEYYEIADTMFNEDVNVEFEKLTKENPDFKGKSKYEDLIITINLSVDIEGLLRSTLKAESRARDSARIMGLNSMVGTIEVFMSDNGHYPEESACFDEVDFIDKRNYFAGGNLPKDPNGEQVFNDITCEDGYYYQYLGNDNYGLWTKMENDMNNNTDLTPDEVDELTLKGEIPEKQEEGTYYFLNRIGFLAPSEPETVKVPRKPRIESSEDSLGI
jgi:hypothetical protein